MSLKVCLVTATKNRHAQLERLVRFVLNQINHNWVHLIYNNADKPLQLDPRLPKDKFILINNRVNLKTGKPYEKLGEIYNDILTFISQDTDVVNIMDDDDIFFPNHVEEGVKGLVRGGLTAYKPEQSLFKYRNNPTRLAKNNFEVSIFVKPSHLKKYGFADITSGQHLQWLKPLLKDKQIFVDPIGKPTVLCDWNSEGYSYHISGNQGNQDNFKRFAKKCTDSGDGVITPCSQAEAEYYYAKAKEFTRQSFVPERTAQQT